MDIGQIHRSGWCEFGVGDISNLSEELLRVGKLLGEPSVQRKSVGVVQELIPTTPNRGFQSSLTAKYSTGSFPLHVDTAHWLTPCRYLILGCLDEGDSGRDTVIVDFRNIKLTDKERSILLQTPFKITNGRNSFYGTILSKDRDFIRYDPGCMTQTVKVEIDIERIFSYERTAEIQSKVRWKTGKIVVIDNWRMLHGRCEKKTEGTERTLYRVVVT